MIVEEDQMSKCILCVCYLLDICKRNHILLIQIHRSTWLLYELLN